MEAIVFTNKLQKNSGFAHSTGVFKLRKSKQNQFTSLSKKAINKICQTFQKYDLNVQNVFSELEKIEVPSSAILIINEQLPIIVESIFDKGNGITEISCDNIRNVVTVLSELILDCDLSKAIITIGLGASDEMPSLRLPSYILPAIKALRKIKEIGLNIGLPTIRVFKATHAGIYANNIDLEKTKIVTDVTLKFLSDFVYTFYPDIFNNFIFESDIPFKGTEAYSIIHEIANKIKELPGLEKELSVIKTMGEHHGRKNGIDNSIIYAAFHPFYNQAIISKTAPVGVTNFIIENPCPKIIIDFGGKSQKKFNKIIMGLRTILSSGEFLFPALINVIVKPGQIPTYYLAELGDISLSNLCSSFNDYTTDLRTKNDYDMIKEEIGHYEYLRFIKEFQELNKI